MPIQSYKDLIVWQRSVELTIEIYRVTDVFPREEVYGLVSQMRRSSISIPSNIAEGYKRRGTGEYLRFLGISNGSSAELETQIIIAKKLYPDINFSKAEALLEGIQKMLSTIIRKLNPQP